MHGTMNVKCQSNVRLKTFSSLKVVFFAIQFDQIWNLIVRFTLNFHLYAFTKTKFCSWWRLNGNMWPIRCTLFMSAKWALN